MSRWFGTFCQHCHRLLQTDSRYADSPSGTPAKCWLTSAPRCKTCCWQGPAETARMHVPLPNTATSIAVLRLHSRQLLRMAVKGFSLLYFMLLFVALQKETIKYLLLCLKSLSHPRLGQCCHSLVQLQLSCLPTQ